MAEMISAIRLLSLRCRLDNHQQEKSRLIAEITAGTTAPHRKKAAMVRYTVLIEDIREISKQLGLLHGR